MGKKILVIDDGRGRLKGYSLWLEEAGYEVTRAGGSLAALFALARVEPDLVIGEPVMNNLALARELKAYQDTRRVPIVMISAKDTPKSRAAAFKAGCDAYLPQYLSSDGFVAEIKRFLRDRRPKRLAGFVRAQSKGIEASRMKPESKMPHVLLL
jgi:DNA-binding response OmpR family regulator